MQIAYCRCVCASGGDSMHVHTRTALAWHSMHFRFPGSFKDRAETGLEEEPPACFLGPRT